MNTGTWNLYTIDLADYIDVEPGVLYKVSLGMRKSYSLYPCSDAVKKANMKSCFSSRKNKAGNSGMIRKIIMMTAMMNFTTVSISTGEIVTIHARMHITIPTEAVSRNILASNLDSLQKKERIISCM